LVKQDQAAPTRKTVWGVAILAVIGCALILFTWAAAHWDIDRRVAARFFNAEQGWFLKTAQPWWLLYKIGTLPGLLLTLAALLGFYLSLVKANFRPYRRQTLVVFLTTVIAGGILVNAILKPYWGRPRPRQTVEFGGERNYLHPYQRGIPGQGESFPCGHCTMGFIFVSLIVFYRHSKGLAVAGTVFGLGYGGLVGMARVVQGAHFVTDVVWSLGVIGMTAVMLNNLVLPYTGHLFSGIKDMGPGQKRIVAGAMAAMALITTLLFLTRRPFFEAYTFALKPAKSAKEMVIRSGFPYGQKKITYHSQKRALVIVEAQGFGWINAKHRVKMQSNVEGANLIVSLKEERQGYFSEVNHRILVLLPQNYKENLTVRFEK
jgi:membrane-associated PAP2 superfamily phosphatase